MKVPERPLAILVEKYQLLSLRDLNWVVSGVRIRHTEQATYCDLNPATLPFNVATRTGMAEGRKLLKLNLEIK